MTAKSAPKEASPTISILVYRDDLKNISDNGLSKKLRCPKALRTWKRVTVQAIPNCAKDALFYAPASLAPQTPLQFSRSYPGHPEIVQNSDNFEISFVGMSVSRQDAIVGSNNELLLYSLKKKPGETCEPDEFSADDLTIMPVPASFALDRSDFPSIHYDPVTDGHDIGTVPDTFVPIPASKSMYMQRRGQKGAKGRNDEEQTNAVSMRFSILEIDKVNEFQAKTMSSIGNLLMQVQNAAPIMPYAQIFSSTLGIANALGDKVLKNYAKPDHVMTRDVEFFLQQDDGEESEGEQSGSLPSQEFERTENFLRYGYYFFLSQKVDAQLYTQTNASSQSVRLMMKRDPYTPAMAAKGEKEYFPLTGVSYVVVKVSRGCRHSNIGDTKSVALAHKKRLYQQLQISDVMEMLSKMKGQQRRPSVTDMMPTKLPFRRAFPK